VRSLIYSVLAYVLRAPGSSLIGLAIAQAGAVAVILSFIRRLLLPGTRLWTGIAVGAAVSCLTSAAWYAAYVMPDIFAGVTIGGALVLTVFLDRLGTPARILLVVLVAFGVTCTAATCPSPCVPWGQEPPRTSGCGAGRQGGSWCPWRGSPARWCSAVAALFATSFVAFGEASLSPKRYPSCSPGRSRTARAPGTCASIARRTIRDLRSARPQSTARGRPVPVAPRRGPRSRKPRA
jgi:hypothetical protein